MTPIRLPRTVAHLEVEDVFSPAFRYMLTGAVSASGLGAGKGTIAMVGAFSRLGAPSKQEATAKRLQGRPGRVSRPVGALGPSEPEIAHEIASRTKAGHDLDHDGSAKNIRMKTAIGSTG